MSDWKIDEAQLYDLNTLLARADDVIIHNCVTRTAQESKLFPLMPYLMLCFYDAYYRFPDLIRAASARISPEECGHRARDVSMPLSKLSAWGTLNFYLNGRASLIKLGLLRPQDNLEDLWTVVDWWQRFSRSYHRNSGHAWTFDASDIAQEHPERVLQVFEADAWGADEKLRKAAAGFVAAATQYSFLANCESRMSLQASGPYRLGDRHLMHTRDFMRLGNCDYSWLDGVADGLSFGSLTMAVITKDTAIEVTDWASAYTDPEDYQDNIVGVGLWTSDMLTDRYLPVGMGSAAELTDILRQLTDEVGAATRLLYGRFLEMDARQMTEAGIYSYLYAAVGISQLAGTFDHSQWEIIDERTDRLWSLHNEEYSLDSYLDNFALMAGHQASQSEYWLHPVSYAGWRRAGGTRPLPAPGRNAFPVPATVLIDDDYPRRVNADGLESCRGSSTLPRKTRDWLTTRGMLSQDELNMAAREFDGRLAAEPWRHYDEQWVKWNHGTPEADELYRYVQRGSRHLEGRGSSLTRADIDAIRTAAGEGRWSEALG